MGKLLTVKQNYYAVLLPSKNGDGGQRNYTPGDQVLVTDAEYAAFNPATLNSVVVTTSGLPDPFRKSNDPRAGNYIGSGAASGVVTLQLGSNDLTLTGNVTAVNVAADSPTTNVVGPKAGSGSIYIVKLTQDATGGRTVTWGSKFKFAGGTAPTLSGANKTDLLHFITYDGGNTLYELSRSVNL
jgi:hypothetical protein